MPHPPDQPSQTRSAIRHRRIRQLDPETNRARVRSRHAQLTPAEKLERSWRLLARPYSPTAGSANSRDRRKTSVARAYMPWSDRDEVVRTYMAAAVLTELFGVRFIVDHMVPLTSPLVCGLHTHDNLRVMRADENRVKSNTYWPQMWPVEWGTLDFLLSHVQYPSH